MLTSAAGQPMPKFKQFCPLKCTSSGALESFDTAAGLPMPGMGGPPVVLGLNGPVPPGMMMPQYGAPPPYPPCGGPPPRFLGGPPQLPAVRAGRMHRANDDLNKVHASPGCLSCVVDKGLALL